jgi:hypothetical protein
VEDCQCKYVDDFVDCVPLPTCEPGGNFVDVNGKIYGRAAWPEPDEMSAVGLFEGAWFRTKGAYRPELRCRMRSDDDVEPGEQETTRFCKVCREALTLEVVSNTGSAAAWAPPNLVPLELSKDAADLLFSVTLHVPASPSHDIAVLAWAIDGQLQPGQTGLQFMLDPASLTANVPHEIAVTILDQSPFVHPGYAEGQARLEQTIAWSVTTH